MDRQSMLSNYGEGQTIGDSRRSTSILFTKRGYFTNMGVSAAHNWDSYHDLAAGSLAFEDYLVFGWAKRPDLGINTYWSNTDNLTRLPNTLGVIPDCVWLLENGYVIGITHKDFPDEYFLTDANLGRYSIEITPEFITPQYPIKNDSDPSGAIYFKQDSTKVQMGVYAGSGVNQNIPTPGMIPKIVIVKRSSFSSGYCRIAHITEYRAYRFKYGDDSETNKIRVSKDLSSNYYEGFALMTSDNDYNHDGSNYAWWAFA